MSKAFWQAKIEGLLQGSLLKPLQTSESLEANLVDQASAIASASDRALFDLLPDPDAAPRSVTVSHLLSGEKLSLDYDWQRMRELRTRIETTLIGQSPLKAVTPTEEATVDQLKQQFWWLWRCLPEVIAKTDKAQLLMPEALILPDVSLWSQASITAAMSGALMGYREIAKTNGGDRPYLAVFSFTPVQELIKASRKMRDFWAGSWVLHYLSAKICWKLAQQYGPDSLIYPSLFQQPLIDLWLLEKWPEFSDGLSKPHSRKLLTAGFPNVIVMLLPQQKAKAAMQTARQTLNQEWLNLGDLVYTELHTERRWMPELKAENRTWQGWLKAQWQPYWTALPVGHLDAALQSPLEVSGAVPSEWLEQQNFACNLKSNQLFKEQEVALLEAVAAEKTVAVNAGSWWPYIFDQLRFSLSSVKSARVWKLPTAFGPRSTISGFGPVVYPHDNQKRITETDASQFWGNQWEAELGDAATPEQRQNQAGLFDGREQLNASETLKRGLHKILHSEEVLNIDEDEIAAAYPDLTAGVAGYLKTYSEFEEQQVEKLSSDKTRRHHFTQVCDAIVEQHSWAEKVAQEMRSKWGIPWIDGKNKPKKHHSRLLNPSWLVEDATDSNLTDLRQQLKQAISSKNATLTSELRQQISEKKAAYRKNIHSLITGYYPNNNPADWYVLAAGDGDGMRHWLKGKPLENYEHYMPDSLDISEPINSAFAAVKKSIQKRMGPSTHAALSRALLDFSNQLVPYLTEQRYAGRLIYSGGDDVLAYTNLWEWDQWLWDIRQCFRGADDPKDQFESTGNYWKWKPTSDDLKPDGLNRPLFTLGKKATVSFGLVIAHHSVPLAIALENLWDAEEKAKAHFCDTAKPEKTKDAVQVRVIYANGNILKATSKFGAFDGWKQLLPPAGDPEPQLTSALFEQAAQLWSQHPAPVYAAIEPWTKVFCSRRDLFGDDGDTGEKFRQQLAQFLKGLWHTTQEQAQSSEIQNWLKLAAFVIRTRIIKTPGD